ncbi:hypothetical protein [Nocardioides houyundeii]|uniref:hypothetical protein n=1 Tax=Nocardioides houyundeii TaxID=2045452 RepID=UPI000DF23265|nr:hypothetical protein [Nocardioides houyundeii]
MSSTDASAAGTAKDEASRLAGTTKDEVRSVAEEAKTQARNVMGDARTMVDEQSRTGRDRLVETARTFGQDLEEMADNGPGGMAGDLARQVAGKARELGDRLDGREPSEILEDVRSFARERPGTFLLGALAAGLVFGRVARGAKDASGSDSGSGMGSSSGMGSGSASGSSTGSAPVGTGDEGVGLWTGPPAGGAVSPPPGAVSPGPVAGAPAPGSPGTGSSTPLYDETRGTTP